MKRFFLILLLVVIALSCGTVRTYERMTYAIDCTVKSPTLDSLFSAEELPPIHDSLWITGLSFIDYETKAMVFQATYIKNDSTMYTVTQYGNMYDFKKRIIRTVVENKKKK